ncbi:MAG: flavodoxin family protein [Thermoleophilia bacterium]|jgi:multimeric flavodoxin WrbA
MKVLGISCGRRNGNTEILVKEALMGAEECGAEIELVHLHDLTIKPCTGCNACAIDMFDRCGAGHCIITDDDLSFIDEQIMECDGLILGSPVYDRSCTGYLKTLGDRMGLSHDVAFRLTAKKQRQERGATGNEGPDERSFKPRVASLIAVGAGEWDTLALPSMSIFAMSLQMEVVDRIRANGIGFFRVVSLHEDLLERAHRSGRHVAETLSRPIEEADYIGEPGLCPICQSTLIEVRHGADPYPTVCAVCGVKGTLSVVDGQVCFDVSEEERVHSRMLLSGKLEYMETLAGNSLKPPAEMGEIFKRTVKYKNHPPYSKPPRDQQPSSGPSGG